MSYELSRVFGLMVGPQDTGTPSSSPALSSAFVFETSGTVWFAEFVAPVGQTSATLTLHAYCTAVTGSPTFEIEVRNGYSGSGDADRPETGGSDLASSSSSVTPTANTWATWTCTVSLTQGNFYFVIIKNTHATPASNHATFQYRGSLDAASPTWGIGGWYRAMTAGYTDNGFAGPADPTVAGNAGTFVVKFADGTLLGMPYVSSASHASNTNKRGNRFSFDSDVVVSGVGCPFQTSSLSSLAIYKSDGTLIVSASGDSMTNQRTLMVRFAPVTLTGGVSYDAVASFSSSFAGTIYTMGEAEGSLPADILACRLPGLAYVDGATPGSFTADTSQCMLVGLLIDNFPNSGGGSPSSMFGGGVINDI